MYVVLVVGGYGGGDFYIKFKFVFVVMFEEKGGGDLYVVMLVYVVGGDLYVKCNLGLWLNFNVVNDVVWVELFGGFSKVVDVFVECKYGYEGWEMEEDFDEDEEIEGIK